MSAFVVSKEHIDALVRLAMAHRQRMWGSVLEGGPNVVGQLLQDACVESVKFRYPDAPDDLPGPVDHYYERPYQLVEVGRLPTLVEGLKLVDCYEYQSCEHPGWKGSRAEVFCDALKGVLIDALPGYQEAPWGWPPEAMPGRKVVA